MKLYGQAVDIKTIITDSVLEAATCLQNGQTVVFPTETVYGLGADATNPSAVEAIFQAKKRPPDNPLIVHIYSLDQVDELAQAIPEYAWQLMGKFFPGPLTVLLPKSDVIPDITTAGSSKVCLRMPSLEIAREFLKACRLPVAAPSANLSGKPSPTRWQDCLEDMNGRVGAILKGPDATFGLESTIVDCSGQYPVLMRPGIITLEELAKVTPEVKRYTAKTPVALPGMKYRHYAPKAKVVLINSGHIPELCGQHIAYIGLDTPAFKTDFQYIAGSLEQYAVKLFSFMRECDRRGIGKIYAQAIPEKGLGLAIMNRLTKAAGI